MKPATKDFFNRIDISLLSDIILAIQESTSKYKEGYGASCPVCNSGRAQVYRKAGDRIRYHVCQKCGLRFKSIEY